MKSFCTDTPLNSSEHFMVKRLLFLEETISKITSKRCISICAPRKTGKTTFLLQIQNELEKLGYCVLFISNGIAGINELKTLFDSEIEDSEKFILICDDFSEQSNEFQTLLLSYIYDFQQDKLKGISSIITTDTLMSRSNSSNSLNCSIEQNRVNLDFFLLEEVKELFEEYANETGKKVDEFVCKQILQTTYGNPYLVSAFARTIHSLTPEMQHITNEVYDKAENWHINNDFDNYLPSLVSESLKIRPIIERFLFKDTNTYFDTERNELLYFYENAVIRPDDYHLIRFWTPFYKKRIFNAFYPQTVQNNLGESSINQSYTDEIHIKEIVSDFKTHVKKNGYTVYKNVHADGFHSIKEAVLVYNFEDFLRKYIGHLKGSVQLIANTALGQTGKLVSIQNKKWVIETRVYVNESQFNKGRNLLATNCKNQQISEGVYLVFLLDKYKIPSSVCERKEVINGVIIHTFIIPVNEMTDLKAKKK